MRIYLICVNINLRNSELNPDDLFVYHRQV